MNLVDCHVTEVLSEPWERYGKWWVPVEYNSWGHTSITEVMCCTKEQAEDVKPGYVFQA